jgi:hypothetical protein
MILRYAPWLYITLKNNRALLHRLYENARLGIVINDLHRTGCISIVSKPFFVFSIERHVREDGLILRALKGGVDWVFKN